MACPSVQLFVDRAQAVRSDFQVTERNAGDLAELCRRLEGLPLAIELVAARSQVLTPARMLADLQQLQRVVPARARGREPRHRTLWDAIDWSYRLLSPPLQRLFARLSVFRGGFTLEAAEAVCGTENAADALDELSLCSLVMPAKGGSTDRFVMLETVREFAGEQLAAEERGEIEQRHGEYFLALAEAAQAEMAVSRWQPADGLERLQDEHDNLRAAIEWALQRAAAAADPTERTPVLFCLRLVGALGRFWWEDQRWTEGRQYLVKALGLGKPALPGVRSEADPTHDPALLRACAHALDGAALLAQHQGDVREAEVLHEESLRLWRTLGDARAIGTALFDCGYVAELQSDFERARSLYRQSLAIRRKLEDTRGVAACLNRLGWLLYTQEAYAAARRFFEQALALFRRCNDPVGMATSQMYLRDVAFIQGRLDHARSLGEESLAAARASGNQREIVGAICSLASTLHAQADYPAARTLYEESLAIGRAINDRREIARSLGYLGRVTAAEGDLRTARSLGEEGLAIWREVGEKYSEAWAHMGLAFVAQREGDLSRAEAHFRENLALRRAMNDCRGIAHALRCLGWLSVHQNDPVAARTFHEEALAIGHRLGCPDVIASGLFDLAYVARDLGDFPRAVARFRDSLSRWRELASQRGEAECLFGLATIAARTGDPTRAARLLGAAEALFPALGHPGFRALRSDYERDIAAIRDALGEPDFTTAREEGRTMGIEKSLGEAE
jgi:tetratricopeptide (TPR) repeat protein